MSGGWKRLPQDPIEALVGGSGSTSVNMPLFCSAPVQLSAGNHTLSWNSTQTSITVAGTGDVSVAGWSLSLDVIDVGADI